MGTLTSHIFWKTCSWRYNFGRWYEFGTCFEYALDMFDLLMSWCLIKWIRSGLFILKRKVLGGKTILWTWLKWLNWYVFELWKNYRKDLDLFWNSKAMKHRGKLGSLRPKKPSGALIGIWIKRLIDCVLCFKFQENDSLKVNTFELSFMWWCWLRQRVRFREPKC